MADKATSWPTAITQIEPNHVRVRGYDIAELMGSVSFGAAVYLILRGELPSLEIARLMDAILVSSIDHGATPPSVNAARTVASTGAGLSAAVAAGIMAINRHHGGAIEQCAAQLGEVVKRSNSLGGDLHKAAAAVIEDLSKSGTRMAGFGHRIHTNDPRTQRLFDLAQAAGISGRHVQAALAVQAHFKAAGKPPGGLPINVDGAIGAILADLGFPPAAMNGLFMIARTPGLVAHVAEEQARCRPMRTIDAGDHVYDGPPPRSIGDRAS